MSGLPGLPKPLEGLLRGLLEENHLSSWTSDWADGDVKVTIRFTATKKNGEDVPPEAAGSKVGFTSLGVAQDSSSDSDDDTTLGGGKCAVITEHGTAGKPRRYHLLELANSPPDKQPAGSFPPAPCTTIMTEEEPGGLGRRGMTTSTSSSSEDTVPDKDPTVQNTRSYRPINIRDFGNTYSSSSAENSSPEGFDEVDSTPPLKVYNQTNASDTADNFDATTLVDITE